MVPLGNIACHPSTLFLNLAPFRKNPEKVGLRWLTNRDCPLYNSMLLIIFQAQNMGLWWWLDKGGAGGTSIEVVRSLEVRAESYISLASSTVLTMA